MRNIFPLVLLLSVFFNACREKQVDNGWAMVPFVKVDSVNPIMKPGSLVFTCPVLKQEVKWEEKDVFNPAAVVRGDSVYLLFRAEDMIGKYAGTSRIGLAASADGIHFVKRATPVLYPDNDAYQAYEWEGGVEDPRVVASEDGRYFLTYTAYDGKTARLMLASSTDLLSWTKHGPVLTGKYLDSWSKSGAIIARRDGQQMVATRINGKYWMYFGDTKLYLASSDDLIHWTPLEDEGKLKPVLEPRPGMFDSRLVESGPYALLKDEGILLIYNSMNLDEGGDPELPKGAYTVGQVLFSKEEPEQVKARLDNYIMRPDKPYETDGQVNQVCFVEGMVFFQEKWFLYYGTADSRIAVAVHQP